MIDEPTEARMTGLTGRSLIRQGFIVLLLALVTGEGVFTGLTIFGLRGRDPESRR